MTDDKFAYSKRKFDVVPYDPGWADLFLQYKKKLEDIFGASRIEHVGSTSVPGMAGKQCIDILVIIPDLACIEERIRAMEQAGFEYAGEFVMPDSRLFRVMRNSELIANIHFFPAGHPHANEMLRVRDYLRSQPEEVRAYSRFKTELFLKYSDDYASYRKHKDQYMTELISRL